MEVTNDSAGAYFTVHREQMIEELFDFLRIPSVSLDEDSAESMRDAADFLLSLLKRAGLEHVCLLPTTGAPIVYADWLHQDNAPTVLLYGHYDVQPAGPDEAWETPAFCPEVRMEQIYGRGVSDDKGPVFLHIKAMEAILQTKGQLACNVRIVLEGEEETGSNGLIEFLHHDSRLIDGQSEGQWMFNPSQVDTVLISDTPFLVSDQPSLCMSVRGFCGVEVEVQGPRQDLHSGGYGGLVLNPAHALSKLIASLHTEDGRVAVDHFYEGIRSEYGPLTSGIQLPPDEWLSHELGVPALDGEQGYTPFERMWIRPTLDVTRLLAGDVSSSPRTVIPSVAKATITARLVEGQDPRVIAEQIIHHLERRCPPGVVLRTNRLDEARAWAGDSSHPAYRHAQAALEYGFGRPAGFIRMGGSIPVLSHLEEVTGGAPIVLLSLGLPSDQVHAPNEHWGIDQFDRGMQTLLYYYQMEHPTFVKG